METGLALRMYRLLLPAGVRTLISDRLEPETRNQLVSVGAALLSRNRARVNALRLLRAQRKAGGSARIVLAGSRAYLCEPLERQTAAAQSTQNLDRVCAALEAADVPYFRLRPKHYQRTAVAVDAAHRARAMAALGAAISHRPAYVCGVARDGKPLDSPKPVYRRRALGRFDEAPVLRVAWFRATPDGSLRYDDDLGCDLEFWSLKDGQFEAAQPNRVLGVLEPVFTAVEAEPLEFTSFVDRDAPSRKYPTHPYICRPLIDEVTFPIDAVYTWVNGSDPEWNLRREKAYAEVNGLVSVNEQAANHARYATRDELRYSLRSVLTYAPWIRHIYLVTDDQVPSWLEVDNPKLTVVSHRKLFDGRGKLPTFNSHAIESQLHHIEGLSEHFIYFNDDVFLGRPQSPETFFHGNGMSKFYPSKALLPMGPRDDHESPATIAGKNNRDILVKLTGRVVATKMRHVPHALTKEVLFEIEERYKDLVEQTAAHQFRHPDDVALLSSLAHFYAYATHRATPHDMSYDYADLAQRSTPRRLSRFLDERALDVFCLNDTVSDATMLERQTKLLTWFLEAYYPVPSPFEKDRRN